MYYLNIAVHQFDKKHPNIIILKHERENCNKSVLVNVYTVHCFMY